jgi:hypothetical protein
MRYFFCIFIITVLGACREDAIKLPPKNIITREQFTKLLVDFSLAESAAGMNIKNYTIHKLDSAYAFNPLKENNVTMSQYDSTLIYYSSQPALYREIYESVLQRLNDMQTKRAVKNDSLKKDSLTK